MNERRPNWEFIFALVAVIAPLVGVLASVGDRPTAINSLVWGWATFLFRVLPRAEIRWDGVAFFLVGLAIVLACAHSFLRWLMRNWGSSASTASPRWRLGSTFALVSLFLMMFVVGIALTGITHQVGWLANSPEPLVTSKIQSLEDNARSEYRMGLIDPTTPARSWIESILPFAVYVVPDTDRDSPWNDPRNAESYENVVPLFINPLGSLPLKSPDGFGLSHFAGNSQVFERSGPMRASELDGSRTLLVGEVNAGLVPWGQPDNCRDPAHGLKPIGKSDASPQELGFGSPGRRSGSTSFVLMDGSVQTLDNSIDPRVLEQLSGLQPVAQP